MPLPHGTWVNCLNDARRRGVPLARSVQDVPFPGSDPRIAMRATGNRVDTTIRYTMRTWVGLFVLCLGAAVTLLNMAVLSPLLRSIGEEFGTSDATTGQLATLGSLVGVASSLGATPWMDRWSRRTWFRLEGFLVLIAIVVSALAPSFGWLMVGRVLASCGAAVIMANCMTGARELFHDPVWRNRAIGIIVSATTFAFVLGMPILTQIEARLGWGSRWDRLPCRWYSCWQARSSCLRARREQRRPGVHTRSRRSGPFSAMGGRDVSWSYLD